MDSGLHTQYTAFGYRTQNKSDLVRNLLKSKEKSFKKRYGLSDPDYNIIMKSVEILKSERSKPRVTFICSDLFNRPYLSLYLTLNEVSGYPREIQYKVVSYIICGRLRK